MHGFILFILGCFLGGFVGVALMCMLQINRINRYEMEGKRMMKMRRSYDKHIRLTKEEKMNGRERRKWLALMNLL